MFAGGTQKGLSCRALRQGGRVGGREIEQLSHVIAPHLEATTTPLSAGNYIISRPRRHDLEVAEASKGAKDLGQGE